MHTMFIRYILLLFVVGTRGVGGGTTGYLGFKDITYVVWDMKPQIPNVPYLKDLRTYSKINENKA